MTINPPNNPNLPPVIATPPAKKGIHYYAQTFGDFMKGALVILFWGIIACTAVAIAVIACKTILWASDVVLQALGG